MTTAKTRPSATTRDELFDHAAMAAQRLHATAEALPSGAQRTAAYSLAVVMACDPAAAPAARALLGVAPKAGESR